MEFTTKRDAYMGVSRAILAQNMRDLRAGKDIHLCTFFARSPWCEVVCDIAEVSVDRYRRMVAEEYVKAVYGMKPKRIKTYLIAGVLKEWKRYS